MRVLDKSHARLLESKGLLAVPVMTGGSDCEASVRVENRLLTESKGLLTVPVMARGRHSEAGVRVKDRLLSLQVLQASGLGLHHS